MDVSLEERWESLVDRLVSEGRYDSPSEVVREGLRLIEEREAKLSALRATLDGSIAQGGEVTDAELDSAISAKVAQLRTAGYSG